nr:hypothetical protein B0A51_09834 [Rachicladosporium sp. CCFEE 5018]
MRIIILGTCDTKLDELLYLRQEIIKSSQGRAAIVLIDAGRTPVHHDAITYPQEVLTTLHAPSPSKDVSTLPRGEVIKYMSACAINACKDALRPSQVNPPHMTITGVISAGGTGGTSLASAVMREVFPIGFPKLIVSTVASGDCGPIVEESDITMMNSVVDIAGTNSLLKRILSNAAGAIVGMADAYERPMQDSSHAQNATDQRKRVGLTMFGVTTPCVDKIRDQLESMYPIECFVFHCTGHGGKAMERLVREGKLDAVLDITTTEVCDHLMGGNMSAGPDRLEAALQAGIPCIISVGATDMVNFGAIATVPEKYQSRKLFEHNPMVTLMRTSPEECKEIGDFIAWKINRFAKVPKKVQVVLPKGGVSMIATKDAPFYDADADKAIFDAIETGLKGSAVEVISDERQINDESFAVDVAERMARLMDL